MCVCVCVCVCEYVGAPVSFFHSLVFLLFVRGKKVKKVFVLVVNFCTYLPIKMQAFLIRENDYLK